MDRAEVTKRFEQDWGEWTATVGSFDPVATRTPDVCGTWTAHDVVNHVQAYVRFHLVNVRGAFSGVAPTREEINGDRKDWSDDDGGGMDVDSRNESIRVRGLELSWQQLLDECAWLGSTTLEFVDGLTEDEVTELVGWVHFWEPEYANHPNHVEGLMIRRLRDIPAAFEAMPAGQLVLPDKHVASHHAQLRTA
ncbi:hypothetical protein [Tenggerimyces flavus]|uniref:Mycothiol-dependent maleylpyruvate isomerase metal-binding domain-containing protein n=1 Tax=Tenggerimyces flavus TaxID=1708749 RepID=A0ABV7Y7P9_9ACTN|nr:hypothetical protein [Tenggerimyces flavus]MBM7785904.1 hypothetical protein [Tenggerimyces flavus]